MFDIVASGLGKRGELLKEYHHISHRLHTEHTPELLRRFDRAHAELDRTQSWDISNQVEDVISRLKLDPEARFEQLSGGQKRRVLLARALVIKPDILLLDEPTNHLDIDSIDWLEGFLKSYPGTVLFVTHDRMFMRHLATRIVELDRGRIFSWSCDYQTFLERKQMALENEEVQRQEFEKKLTREEVWIRRGVKARRVRNEGRVKALERMREEKKKAAAGRREGQYAGAGGRAFRAFGDQGFQSGLLVRKQALDQQFFDHDHARGQDRRDRPQRLGENNAVAPVAWTDDAAAGQSAPGDEPGGRLLRSVARTAR